MTQNIFAAYINDDRKKNRVCDPCIDILTRISEHEKEIAQTSEQEGREDIGEVVDNNELVSLKKNAG